MARKFRSRDRMTLGYESNDNWNVAFSVDDLSSKPPTFELGLRARPRRG